jgi:hypothetical protein
MSSHIFLTFSKPFNYLQKLSRSSETFEFMKFFQKPQTLLLFSKLFSSSIFKLPTSMNPFSSLSFHFSECFHNSQSDTDSHSCTLKLFRRVATYDFGLEIRANGRTVFDDECFSPGNYSRSRFNFTDFQRFQADA